MLIGRNTAAQFSVKNAIMKKFFQMAFLVLVAISAFPREALAVQTITAFTVGSIVFPTIAIPSSGTNDLTINPSNSTTSGGEVLYGTGARGQFNLTYKGTGPYTAISVDITDISTPDAGLTLSNFTGFYKGSSIDSFPSPPLAFPGIKTPFYVGATETVSASVAPGNYNGQFTFNVVLQ